MLSQEAQKIVDLVRRRPALSFVELLNHFPELRAAKNEEQRVICFESHPTIIMWVGFGKAGCTAMKEALDSGLIHPRASSVLVYMFDGGMLNLPIARRAHNYKEDHWLPVVLWPGSREQGLKAQGLKRKRK
jgi:hypothetical protein